MCGTGFVDNQRGNSAGLPVGGNSVFDPGNSGGFWYFDKVGAAGADPLEQVFGSGTTGTTSPFFELGTVRMQQLESITTSLSFTIPASSQVNATIGPLSDIPVAAPTHNHIYILAQPDGNAGYPLIVWGNVPGGRMMFRTPRAGTDPIIIQYEDSEDTNPGGPYDAESGSTEQKVRQSWKNFFDRVSSNDFGTELSFYYGDDWTNLDTCIIEQGFPTGFPVGGITDLGGGFPLSQYEFQSNVVPFDTWWPSPYDALNSATLQQVNDPANWGGLPGDGAPNTGGIFQATGVLDVRTSAARIDQYLPTGGTTNTHRHKITLDIINNVQDDFTGGNTGGSGTTAGGFGSGLGGTVDDQITVSFAQSEVFMDMTEGVFTFKSSFKKPTPDVAMRPQRQVPIINPFHKSKYIIKAF